MMRLAAGLLEGLMGPWLKSITVPILILAVITGWHQVTKARAAAVAAKEAALVNRGRSQCLSEVELAQTRAELAAERQRAATARDDASAAIGLAREVGELKNAADARIAQLEAAAAGSNPGCLSDGMRQKLWGPGAGKDDRPGGAGSSGSSGSAKR